MVGGAYLFGLMSTGDGGGIVETFLVASVIGAVHGGIVGLDHPIDHRAIGVVYDPRAERWGRLAA